MQEIGIGMIGTGFMGKTHALAYRAMAGVFLESRRPTLVAVADIDADAARRAAAQFGFARAIPDWKSLVTDPAVDVVSITTPNLVHKEMAG
ncbi:hypothetical protein EOS_41830 [Caballeronia mineralivorans PML1(12)]|uniref:Gfo/Idh/MocA-like oxidoreductase N-terminal domain-containing protein n=1 Tax=Caballeronia mineralivorans PML1(12) TaxID=908627 RepID=A0A0J1CIT5_9BURK|nr:Gfo/Idh/MocA family oxidoreductase [Caballeronia mineralivorans]KLU20391.1 hypothetical protein EOS_41830 [Caballeronia mineralivorans PML1(12)]